MGVETVKHTPESPKKKGLHYGYAIVTGGFLAGFLMLICQRALSIALTNIQDTLGITYAQVGLIASYFGLVFAAAAFFWGWLADHEKVGPRLALTFAGACTAVGLFLFGFIGGNDLNLAIITYTLVGLGCAGIYLATVPKLVSAWFVPEKRGHAMSFIAPGGTFAAIILGLTLPTAIKSSGWQNSFMVLGILGAVCTILFFVLLRDDPAEKGLTPVGSPEGTPVVPAPKKEKKSNNFGAVLKMKITWHIGISYIVYQLAWMANTTFYVASIIRAGYSPVKAGLVVTISGLTGVLWMQLFGPLSDKLERKTVISIGAFGYAIFAIIYYFVLMDQPGFIMLTVLIVFMNGMFGTTPVIMAAFADYYPANIRGTGNGVVSTMSMVGRYGGPFLAGLAIDAGGGKTAYAFIFTAAAMIVFGILTLTWPKLKNKTAPARKAA
jgi:sugar phosphate permease